MLDNHIHMYYGKSDTPQEFLEKAAAAGITGGNIISLYPAKHGLVESADQRWEHRLEKVLEFTSQAPGFHPLFWIDPTADDFEKQIHTAAEQGIHGFKIICSHYYPHDTLPAVQVMAECQLPVLFHCGILYSKNCAAKYNRPIEFEELLAVKGLRFALAHAGWPWTDEFNAIVGEGRNGFFHSDIYVDITPGTPFVYRREVLKRLYMSGFDDLPNRVLWGTDGSTNNYPNQHVLLDIETDKKILSEIADPANVFDVPGYKAETYADIWKKVSEDNLNAFHKKPSKS